MPPKFSFTSCDFVQRDTEGSFLKFWHLGHSSINHQYRWQVQYLGVSGVSNAQSIHRQLSNSLGSHYSQRLVLLKDLQFTNGNCLNKENLDSQGYRDLFANLQMRPAVIHLLDIFDTMFLPSWQEREQQRKHTIYNSVNHLFPGEPIVVMVRRRWLLMKW